MEVNKTKTFNLISEALSNSYVVDYREKPRKTNDNERLEDIKRKIDVARKRGIPSIHYITYDDVKEMEQKIKKIDCGSIRSLTSGSGEYPILGELKSKKKEKINFIYIGLRKRKESQEDEAEEHTKKRVKQERSECKECWEDLEGSIPEDHKCRDQTIKEYFEAALDTVRNDMEEIGIGKERTKELLLRWVEQNL